MLALDANIEPFVSSWGAECRPSYDDTLDKWLLPLGWESELTARGIDFETVEIEIIHEP
jgi:hypothetical protein